MQKLKIEITKTYCIDILADDTESQEVSIQKAEQILDSRMVSGTEHYLQTSDTDITVYNVTDTEDPFNPENR
jgi:hypothetical protein